MSSLIAQDGTVSTVLGWFFQAAALVARFSGSRRGKLGGHFVFVVDEMVHFEDSREYEEEIQGSLSSSLVDLAGGE